MTKQEEYKIDILEDIMKRGKPAITMSLEEVLDMNEKGNEKLIKLKEQYDKVN